MPRKTSAPIRPHLPVGTTRWNHYIRGLKRDAKLLKIAPTRVWRSRRRVERWFRSCGCEDPASLGFMVVRRPDGRWIVVLAKDHSPLADSAPKRPSP